MSRQRTLIDLIIDDMQASIDANARPTQGKLLGWRGRIIDAHHATRRDDPAHYILRDLGRDIYAAYVELDRLQWAAEIQSWIYRLQAIPVRMPTVRMRASVGCTGDFGAVGL